MVEWW